MPITTRPITEDERVQFRKRVSFGFGDDLENPEQGAERFEAMMPLDRTVAAFDGDEIVGTLGAYPLEVTVPGGASVPTAGTTMVTVQNTHRRQGVMQSMLSDHLDDTAARGEALAALWSSEAPIYGRFGFGHATSRDVVDAPKDALVVDRPATSAVRRIDPQDVAELLPAVYDRVRSERPGMLSRAPHWWKHNVVYDPEHWRSGSTAKRFVVFEADGGVEGYVIYRQKSDWADFLPEGKVKVSEIIAATERAHSGLWTYLSHIDLFPVVTHWNMPADDPLWWKLRDPRRVTRKRSDALYVRIMDVSSALAARTYETDGSVRIRVDDPFRPGTSGVYELAVSDGIGKSVAVEGEADVSLRIDALGALYLGGSNARSMAAAGLIDGEPDAVAALHRLFHTDAEPWCDSVF